MLVLRCLTRLKLYASRLAFGIVDLVSGGIRFLVCCDGCAVDADEDEYQTLVTAIAARDWASREGGWLLRNPGTDEEWLTCPECSAAGR